MVEKADGHDMVPFQKVVYPHHNCEGQGFLHKAADALTIEGGRSQDLSDSFTKRKDKRMKNTPKIVLLFDGSCNFCTACAEFVRLLDRRHRLQCLPFQAATVPQSYGLTFTQCEQAAWAITPNGHLYQGAQAVCITLDAILGLPFFLPLYRFPGIGHIEDKIYAWVARNRRFFPGIRPYCERPGLPCSATVEEAITSV